MTNQEKKNFLRQYRNNERQIARLDAEIERWRSRAEKVTVRYTGLPGGAGDDRLQSSVEEIVRLTDELIVALRCAALLRRQIKDAIATVRDERLRLLLEYRYVDGMTWEEIAAAMQYGFRQVTRMHGQALSEMKDVLECPT